ncbi:hypothetical protein WHR41_08494 [Cladosporium halotolerans]|uniref:SWIM-type domain-containing protein n=1 Tax=Cladosporium halotolerans TaxID=1052096 RepID=A0AB34KDN3_9PEZI
MTEPAPRLPSTRRLLTSLINTIASSNQEQPLKTSDAEPTHATLSQTYKPALLTLHTLFPNDLLPALDLLDRTLVTRLVVQQPPDTSTADQEPTPTSRPRTPQTAFYLVRSAQQPHHSSHSRSGSRYADPAPQAVYEVRPRAWNCSCPAFAFAAFPPVDPSGSSVGLAGESEDEGGGEDGWRFGGLTRGGRGEVPPVCKHLLACVLAEWGGFGEGAEVREVTVEEVAGWGGGWGD